MPFLDHEGNRGIRERASLLVLRLIRRSVLSATAHHMGLIRAGGEGVSLLQVQPLALMSPFRSKGVGL